MADLPSGTVTFLFTDIEGSTRLVQQYPVAWEAARQRHHAILRAAIETHRGHVFQIVGDAFCAAFATAPDALAASVSAQRAFQSTSTSQESPIITVRMGLHTGPAEVRDGEYQGYLTLAQVQRVMAAAHGSQVVLSGTSAELVRAHLPEHVTLRDLGEHRLNGLLSPERLWQVVAPELQAEFPPLDSPSSAPNNLPLQVTSFLGRERELAELQRLLPTTRLLTLTGSGGTGKTRLSLQVAAEVLDNYTDGVWFIELAPLSDPALLLATVASVLGVREQPGRPPMATLLEWLRPRELLLMLDNCEHLIDACAKFADAVIHASRGTRILVSSREALGIAGEQAFPVPSLSLPDGMLSTSITAEDLRPSEAVRLFVERAMAVQPHFVLTDGNAPAVAQICRRLDGIPLAVELAAARMRSLNAEQIAERLDDRFRLLTGGSRTALPRQQTLRALVDWSYSLLSDPERTLFRRLSVFVDGWTLPAAEAVCAEFIPDDIRSDEVLDLLHRLIDKSLVVADGAPRAADSARFHLLETMRQYAREKLLDSDETNVTRDRHLSFFLRLAEDAEPHLSGAAQATWFARLERDYANLRVAHEWSLQDSDASQGMRLTTALRTLWSVRGPATEGVDWSVRAVSRPEGAAASPVRANALSATAHMLWVTGELVRSNAYGEASLALSRALDYQPGVARALYQLGINARAKGDHKTSKFLLEESLAIREGLDSNAITSTYVSLGWIAEGAGDYDAARKYFEQVMTIAQAAESSHDVAMAFAQLGSLAFLQCDYDGAEALLEQGLITGRAIGYRGAVSQSARGLAYVALQRGQVERAATFCRESLLINRERRNSLGLTACLAACAALAVARGQPERAVRLYGSAAVLLVSNVAVRHRYPHDQAEQERHIKMLRTQLDEARFNAAWEAGSKLTLEQAVAEAEQATQPEQPAMPEHAPPVNTAGLTARELEVLRLVAGGLSDAQIAEQLVISHRTVSTHLTAIYGKLGVNSRGAATRYALEHRLA